MDSAPGDDAVSVFRKMRRWFGGQGPTIQDVIRGSFDANGTLVNPRSVLSHPAVWRGVDLISTSIARVAFDVYQRNPDGSRTIADTHDAHWLIKHRPNEYYSRFQLFKTWAVNTLTHGDGYIWTRREGARPAELRLLESASTTFVQQGDEIIYHATDRFGNAYALDPSEVLHLRGLGTDGFTGLPVTNVLAGAFGLGLTLQRYQNVFFDNGGRPSVAIKLPPEIDTREKIEEFREAWGKVHSGPANAFRPALLMPGAEITPMASDSAIEALANLREHDLVTIANCLGLPPHRIGAKSVSVSYGSLEQENLSFLQDIDGWLVQAEQEMSLKLLRSDEQRTHYVEGNREHLVMMDSETRANLQATQRRNGLISDEELRRRNNLPPPREGETFWVEANLITRDRALAMAAAEAKAAEEELEKPADDEPTPDDQDVDAGNETGTDTAMDTGEDTDTRSQAMRLLTMQLTQSAVGRLQRRAAKSGRIEMKLWRAELGDLPGFERLAAGIEAGEYDDTDHQTLAEQLWLSN